MTAPTRQRGWRLAAKRALDVAASAIALAVTSPVQVGVAVAVRLGMGRPVLFRQLRPGRDGRPFTLVKFRTMTDGRDPVTGALLDDARRLTRLGSRLRALTLDELPQLWNVLKGDMSLVGPRPLLMEYLDRYSPEQRRRHDVLPGLTGWAQINGRNALDWPQRLELDLWYVDNWSLGLDLRILARTASAVARRKGITFRDHVTMPNFRGGAAAAGPPGQPAEPPSAGPDR